MTITQRVALRIKHKYLKRASLAQGLVDSMRLATICKFQVCPSLFKCSEAFVSPQLGSDRNKSILISSPAIPVSLPLRDILGSIHNRVCCQESSGDQTHGEDQKPIQRDSLSFTKFKTLSQKQVNKSQCLNYVHFSKDTNLKYTEEEGVKNPTADSSY